MQFGMTPADGDRVPPIARTSASKVFLLENEDWAVEDRGQSLKIDWYATAEPGDISFTRK